jgi:hypothetical protein
MGGMGGMMGAGLGMPSPKAKAQPSTPEEEELKLVNIELMNNIAAISLKRKNFEKVVMWSSRVLEQDPTNIKALQRRAKVRHFFMPFPRSPY